MFKERLSSVWRKVVDHKDVLIPIAAGVAGALIGAGITAAYLNANPYVDYDASSELLDLSDVSGN